MVRVLVQVSLRQIYGGQQRVEVGQGVLCCRIDSVHISKGGERPAASHEVLHYVVDLDLLTCRRAVEKQLNVGSAYPQLS